MIKRSSWTGRFKIQAVLLILVLLLSACGNATNDGGKVEPSKEANKPATEATETSEPKERTVSTVKGDVVIPNKPERIVGMSAVYADFLGALGVKPIAVENYHAEFPTYLTEAMKDTTKLGMSRTPNFEGMLAVSPDVILTPAWWSETSYDQLTKIAPTVLLPQRDNWRDELKDIAGVLGKEAEAEKVIADLVTKGEEAKAKLDTLVGDETVLYMMVMPKELVVFGETIDRGSFIHKQLGLTPVPSFPQSELSLTISMEKMPEYNPDHLIIQLDDEENPDVKKMYEQMTDNSVWKNLKAVKSGQVYFVGGKEWFSLGMSPLADSYAIDDIIAKFETTGK
ncbi:iron-siderophore ABC transporter substrate-binding protein [Paenibacillus sp. GSMTC-2017]|uniref:ABC transporter substrate-binding protein n=1 Tax=Paenibacillus sp. GSMTC-2017 TaxID=2794350 RepID=UPI0018D9EB15|nr:iron-siderophore ABC transporter substrate-binding protein [Paenibacillus sp. GSMTC-2017]MBH5319075.1 iron-siderophore ABC transporter substrate-binding protein [Paenibacillus sp. GSMTC-2017]